MRLNIADHDSWYMYYFWIVVVTIGISTRLVSLIRNLEQQRRYQLVPALNSHYVTPKSRSSTSQLQALLKRFVTIPATFGNRCSQPYGWCTIPPRLQSLTILVFVLINIVLCTYTYELTDGNLYWPQKSAQLSRYVSDRTGIISLANFPLIWLFGMRNDALMWLTGWGFGTYNAFHRWVARVATLQAVIHSLGYTVMIMESGGWPGFLKYLTKHYFWNGELATLAMCALLAFSVYGIRRAHYEIFLVTHIALSIATLWTMYYHVEIFTKGEWNIFIWPCLVVWILDRVLRVGRTIAFNRRFWNTKATMSYDSASNLVRMDVDGSNNWIKPQPGTYYYIHVLDDILYANQSHPFTLAYVSSDIVTSSSTPLSPLSTRPSPHRTDSTHSSESDALLTPNEPASSNLVFLIRPYDGFTSRLKSHCLLHPAKLRVLIEGPYGHSEPFHVFPNILLIVGGTGIAVPMSHLARLLSSPSHARSVKIVWAVREHAFLASVLRDFSGLLGDERVDMEVHVTQDKEVEAEVLGEDLKSVRIVTRRPDVYAAVHEAARDAGQEKLAVVACGPAGMADQTRGACVEMLRKGCRGVEYFEESFKW
jgi:predicted ferric reductase